MNKETRIFIFFTLWLAVCIASIVTTIIKIEEKERLTKKDWLNIIIQPIAGFYCFSKIYSVL